MNKPCEYNGTCPEDCPLKYDSCDGLSKYQLWWNKYLRRLEAKEERDK